MTGHVLADVAAELLGCVVGNPDVSWRVRDREFQKFGEQTLYRPPGVWVWPSRDLPPTGPVLFQFPAPHHPLEVIAAYRGLCGFSGRSQEDTLAHIEALEARRRTSWVTYTDFLAGPLKLKPVQVRLLYHLITPLLTNGGEPDGVKEARVKLYDEAFDLPSSVVDGLVRDGKAGLDAGIPWRMDFWGGEVYGEIEL